MEHPEHIVARWNVCNKAYNGRVRFQYNAIRYQRFNARKSEWSQLSNHFSTLEWRNLTLDGCKIPEKALMWFWLFDKEQSIDER